MLLCKVNPWWLKGTEWDLLKPILVTLPGFSCQAFSTNTQNLTLARYPYLHLMCLHLRRQPPTSCPGLASAPLSTQVPQMTSPHPKRTKKGNSTPPNIIRHCDSTWPQTAFPAGAKCPGDQVSTMPPTDPHSGPQRIVFRNEIARCLPCEPFLYQNAQKTLRTLLMAWQH